MKDPATIPSTLSINTYDLILILSILFLSLILGDYKKSVLAFVETLCRILTNPSILIRSFMKKIYELLSRHYSMKLECEICYEKDIPFLSLRKKFNEGDLITNINPERTFITHFFPLFLCLRCASICQKSGLDFYSNPCLEILPLLRMKGNSKEYFVSDLRDSIFDESVRDPEMGMTNVMAFIRDYVKLEREPNDEIIWIMNGVAESFIRGNSWFD